MYSISTTFITTPEQGPCFNDCEIQSSISLTGWKKYSKNMFP